MLCAACSAADGLCASSAEAIRLWVCDSAAAISGSEVSAIAVSKFSRSGGNATISSARRLISVEMRSMPLR